MPYLVHCDTFGCVHFRAIIGIAERWHQILELLSNYYRMMSTNDTKYTFENDINDIKIYNISKTHYMYLSKIHRDNEEDIDNLREKVWSIYKPENINTYFWGLVLNCDADKLAKNVIDDINFYRNYKKILKESKLVIE
jgi:hypothetical protein